LTLPVRRNDEPKGKGGKIAGFSSPHFFSKRKKKNNDSFPRAQLVPGEGKRKGEAAGLTPAPGLRKREKKKDRTPCALRSPRRRKGENKKKKKKGENKVIECSLNRKREKEKGGGRGFL